MHPAICILEIRTFAGRVPGASHYFGSLYHESLYKSGKGSSFDLTYKLTILRARAMNKSQYLGEFNPEWTPGDCTFEWEAGSECNAYFSEEEVIAAAREAWREKFPEAKILLVGDHLSCGPQEILSYAPDVDIAPFQAIYDKAKAINFYDGPLKTRKEDWKKMDGYTKEWEAEIVKHFGPEC